jgi:hypothetical protein
MLLHDYFLTVRGKLCNWYICFSVKLCAQVGQPCEYNTVCDVIISTHIWLSAPYLLLCFQTSAIAIYRRGMEPSNFCWNVISTATAAATTKFIHYPAEDQWSSFSERIHTSKEEYIAINYMVRILLVLSIC